MEGSSEVTRTVVQGEEVEETTIQANTAGPEPAGPEPATSELRRLSLENEMLNAQLALTLKFIEENDEKIKSQRALLLECAGLVVEQHVLLSANFPIQYGQGEDSSDLENEEYCVEDTEQLKNLVLQEREKEGGNITVKVENLKASLKSVSEKYERHFSEAKDPSTEAPGEEEQKERLSLAEQLQQLRQTVIDKLVAKEKEINELNAKVYEGQVLVWTLYKIIKSQGFEQGTEVLLAQICAMLNIDVELEKILNQPETGETAEVNTAAVSLNEQANNDEEDTEMTSAEIAGNSTQVGVPQTPFIISVDDKDDDDDDDDDEVDVGEDDASPPVSPHPIPIESDDNDDETEVSILLPVPAVPKSGAGPFESRAQSVQNSGKKQRSPKKQPKKENKVHGLAYEDKIHSSFHCLCTKKFGSLVNLKKHIHYAQQERKFLCHLCDRGYVYPCYLKKHLETSHKIPQVGGKRNSQSTGRVKRPQSSQNGWEEIEPKNGSTALQSKLKNNTTQRKKTKVMKGSGTEISPHRQVSFGTLDSYACACGYKSARRIGLMVHIDEMNQ